MVFRSCHQQQQSNPGYQQQAISLFFLLLLQLLVYYYLLRTSLEFCVVPALFVSRSFKFRQSNLHKHNHNMIWNRRQTTTWIVTLLVSNVDGFTNPGTGLLQSRAQGTEWIRRWSKNNMKCSLHHFLTWLFFFRSDLPNELIISHCTSFSRPSPSSCRSASQWRRSCSQWSCQWCNHNNIRGRLSMVHSIERL